MLVLGLPARFWVKTVIEDTGYETACLTWTAALNAYGYGAYKHQGKNRQAHRVAYEAMYGEIPKRIAGDRAVTDHLCRNRACVNVAHLEIVPNRINILRGETLQAANAAKTHCNRGHEFTPENTYLKYGKRNCRTCTREQQRESRGCEPRALKTHCRRGHEFTEENTYIKPDGRRECRACLKAQRKARTARDHEQRGPAPERKQAACKQGHEFTLENTYYYPNGKRRCRACMQEQSRKQWQNRKR
ncbi:HNH endonuclease signature motif containing protein [Actinomadura sp. LOL_016]|uniref:HNH endonuclease signature motif containing protein n=1 Tax=unclassified Actinomadura TaxID=2626254 RepID=UPI003A80BA44